MKRLIVLTSLLIFLIIVQINAAIGDVAYIYNSDNNAASSFESLLENNGIPVDLIPLDNVESTDFLGYQTIIVGSDTGNWDETLASAVNNFGRPIIGVGIGGAKFFGGLDLFIQHLHCWFTDTNQIYVLNPSHPIFTSPNVIPFDEFQIAFLYTDPIRADSLHAPAPPSDVTLLGGEVEDPNQSHYPLAMEKDKYFLWGFTGAPDAMTAAGSDLFINVVKYFSSTITGTVLYNGEAITNYTDGPAHFWARSSGKKFPISPQYDNTNGRYSIPDVPPDTYSMCVRIDAAEPFNDRPFPGDYEGRTSVEVPVGQPVVNKDIDCKRIMHLTVPVDNLSEIGHISDPYDKYYQREMPFRWDAIAEASTYEIRVDKYQSSPYNFIETVYEKTTPNTQVTIPLDILLENQHYEFDLDAMDAAGLHIGQLMVVYDNGYGWDYRFRIERFTIEYETLYFTDADEIPGSVYKLTDGGETRVYIRGNNRLYNLAIAPDETLYFSDANDNDLYAFIDGREVLVYTHNTYLRDVAFDSHGDLYFSEATGAGDDGKIYRLVGGVATLFYTVELSDVNGSWGGSFTFDADTLYLSSGNITGAKIYKVVDDVPQVVYSIPGGECCIEGITFGDSGEIYYASWNGGNIYKLDTSSVPFTRTLVYSNPSHNWLSDVALARTKYVCYPDLPLPELCVTGAEEDEQVTRYNLTVTNWSDFPDELFEAAPDLPPCGGNENASRTWVDIFAGDGTYLYGFCAFSSSEDLLDKLWFAVPKGESPPDFVYITLEDRGCDIEYTSNLASTALNYQIHSVWASTPPVIDGVISPDEWVIPPSAWAGAMNVRGEIQLCYGQMLVQNDHENLYILVDLTEDTHNDPPLPSEPWGDFFWLTFDVNSDKMIVPGEDINYGCYPGTHELGLQYYQGPGMWTPLGATNSSIGAGFGQGMYSLTDNRIWEFAISLEEIKTGVDDWLSDPWMIKPIRTGLRTYSQEPTFDVYHPSYFPTNFSNLIEIFPAFGSPIPSGDYIFRGVGAIPATEIDEDGYATTVPSYHPYVVDAPFGSFLRIFGNLEFLRLEGVKYYRVLYQQIDVSPLPDPAPLKQSWVNYRWEQVDPMTYKWVSHTITCDDYDPPGLEDVYEIIPNDEDWYFDKLLVGWSSWRFPDGRYRLWLEAFYEDGNPLVPPLPEELNELILTLDNTRPYVEIAEIAHGEEVLGRCDIVYLDADDLQDGLRFTITAHDDKIGDTYINKHLYRYSLAAHFGSNESIPIYSDNYSNHVDEDGPNLWGGVQDFVIPSEDEEPWRPDESCAYQFRLSVRSRTTNGYSRRIHYNEYNEHVTILLGEPGPSCNPGDVSGDGNVTAYDAALILQFVVGLINELPVLSAQSPTNAPQYNYSVTIPELTARAGDRIQVPIAINDTKGLNAGGIVVKYDPSVLRAVDFTASSLLNGAYWKANIKRMGEVRFAFATAEPPKGTGNLLMVEFDVLPNNAGKTSPVIFDTVNLVNSLAITRIDGSVTVLPEHTTLLPNFPNPFNPDTWIPYQLAQDATVVIKIYNQNGQIVRTIDLDQQPAGTYVTKDRAVYWDGMDSLGGKVASGVYFYTLQTGQFKATRKMVILK